MKTALPGSAELLEKGIVCLGYPNNRFPRLIAIDGPDGVGKSSLASWLAWQLGAPAVYLDLFMIRDSKPLRWRTDDLRRIMTTRLDQQKQPLVIEGVRLLEVLDMIGRKADFLAYVDGKGSHGLSQALTDYRARYQPEVHAKLRLKGYAE